MYITSPAVTAPRFDTPPRRSRTQRRHRTAPPATPFVGTVLAALMVSGSFGATLLVDSPAAAYEQGGIDQGETDEMRAAFDRWAEAHDATVTAGAEGQPFTVESCAG